ncbi:MULTISPECIES: hypothetical protein [unclassified Nocardiopsis]|uniref:hypothetical protein n=1 Tax=Nocardiopsis TaxID=2013 RepID=UPI00387AD4EC
MDQPPVRVCVVVSAPAPHDPDTLAAAIAHAAQVVAPEADVYTTTATTKEK